jgi:pilus assembly protein CpaB
MSRRLIFFLFTIVLALVLALMVRSALKSKEAKIQALRQSTVYIVVAVHALSPGDTVDSAALRLVAWPRDLMPPGAFTSLEGLTGKVVKNSLSVNQPLVAAALLAPEKTGGVLPLLIPEGMRAMSIAVDDVSDMAGFVLPHSRVDVLVSVAPGGGPNAEPGSGGDLTKIVLQNIEVLAAAQTLEAGTDQSHIAKVVTLLVTPEQSERLAAASRLGTLQLAMRNFTDQQQPVTHGISVAGLVGAPLSIPPPEAAPPPVAAPVTALPTGHYRFRPRAAGKAVEVIRNGTDHQTIDFLANGRLRPSLAPAPAATLDGTGSEPPAPVH